MARERRTITAMIRIYCHGHHGTTGNVLCGACGRLRTYAQQRLASCPYQAQKPTCARCPIHCYREKERAQIREVMRYAGPRMVWRYPILAVQHLADRFRRRGS